MAKLPLRARVRDVDEAHRAEVPRNKKHAQQKSRIANAVHDKSLRRSVTGRLAMEIESDQQIRAQPHAFPTHEQQHVVIGPGSA